MIDFPNKIVTIVLVFLMLVVSVITYSYVRGQMLSDRMVLNEAVAFIDKVKDKASITPEDLDDLYLGVNASGGTYDVSVQRLIRMATKDEDGTSRTVYLNDTKNLGEGTVNMNVGERVKVTVKEVGVSPAKRLLWTLLRIDETRSEYSLVGAVR